LTALEHWAAPWLTGIRDAGGLSRFDPAKPCAPLVGWPGMAEVDRLAPQHWTSPLGRNLAIDYGGEMPEISVRLQEVLGTTRHPTIGQDGLPIRLVLLSPANRPIQVTTDLPGFWAGSYADVRKDMRAQYPRHPWPEDPTAADPTLRAKPRGT
jgi:ATP-dependent helicase HrpB